jgi:hypothetical protein
MSNEQPRRKHPSKDEPTPNSPKQKRRSEGSPKARSRRRRRWRSRPSTASGYVCATVLLDTHKHKHTYRIANRPPPLRRLRWHSLRDHPSHLQRCIEFLLKARSSVCAWDGVHGSGSYQDYGRWITKASEAIRYSSERYPAGETLACFGSSILASYLY